MHSRLSGKDDHPLSSPVDCNTPNQVVSFEVTVKTPVQTFTRECPFLFTGGTCGPFDVVYSPNSALWKTTVHYSPETVKVVAENGSDDKVVAATTSQLQTLFPETNMITMGSEGDIFIQMKAVCQCDYQTVVKQATFESPGVFYCLMPKKTSQLLTSKPSNLKYKRVLDSIFLPKECYNACDADPECSYAQYEYASRRCFLLDRSDVPSVYQGTPIPTGEDLVGFSSNISRVASHFVNPFIASLQRTDRYSVPVVSDGGTNEFMAASKIIANQMNSYSVLYSLSYGNSKDSSLYKALIEMIGAGHSLLPLSRKMSLPPMEGRTLIDKLDGMSRQLVSFKNDVKFLEQSIQIEKFEKSLSDVMNSVLNNQVQQGSFDFSYIVVEYNRTKMISEAMVNKLKAFEDEAGEIVAGATVDAVIEALAVFVYTYIKASVSQAGLVSPFSASSASVSAVMENWRDVQKALTVIARTGANVADMWKGLGVIEDQLRRAKIGIAKIEEDCKIVDSFISDFNGKTFSTDLNDTVADRINGMLANYSSPVDKFALLEAFQFITSGMSECCEVIFNGMAVVDAGIMQHECNQFKGLMDQMSFAFDVLNGQAMTQVTKAKEIVSQYVLVKGMKEALNSTNNWVTRIKEQEAVLLEAMLSANISISLMSLVFMYQLVQICSLAEYYAGGTTFPKCKSLKSTNRLFSPDEILTTMTDLLGVLQVPTNPFEFCGYVPTSPNPDTPIQHTLNLEGLSKTGTHTFSLPRNVTWLRIHGWGSIADGIESEGNAANFFIERIQIPLPYVTFQQKRACGPSIATKVSIDGDYVILDSKTRQPKMFSPGYSSLTFEFSYKSVNSGICTQEVKTNYMSPCYGKSFPDLPELCLLANGELPEGKPFDSSPPLPSVFSNLTVTVTRSKECLVYPKLGTHWDSAPPKSKLSYGSLQGSIFTPICVGLAKAEGYANPSQMNSKSTDCTVCNEGEYLSNPLWPNAKCQPCPPGTYQDKKAMFACFKCPKGTYQSISGSRACLPCDTSASCCPVEGLRQPLPLNNTVVNCTKV